MPAPDTPLSLQRRNLLRRAGAAGLTLLIPACRPSEPPQAPVGVAPESAGDFADGALRLHLRQLRTGGLDRFDLERLRFERLWPGPRREPASALDWGDYRLSVFEPARATPIFRQGFDTDLSPAARLGITQASVRLPLPRRAVRVELEKRRGQGGFDTLAAFTLDPDDERIDRAPVATATRVDTLMANGPPAVKVDLAILGDGYRESEYPKFVDDARRAAAYLFSVEPFSGRRHDFNVHAVFAASADSGVTDPYLGLKKETVLRSTYYTGGSERSLAAGDDYAVREIASTVACDFVLILANARRYGGSAHFRGPAAVAIDSAAARYLVIHEFAHAFAGLADEYYLPEANGPAYAGGIEPWHPNVTALPDRIKWRGLPGTPTRWNKEEYEKNFAAYVRRYNRLRESGADETAVEKLMAAQRVAQAALLAKNAPGRQVGLFEGANGYAKGVFRSEVDCIMFSLQADYFCAACAAAIGRMLDEHCR